MNQRKAEDIAKGKHYTQTIVQKPINYGSLLLRRPFNPLSYVSVCLLFQDFDDLYMPDYPNDVSLEEIGSMQIKLFSSNNKQTLT